MWINDIPRIQQDSSWKLLKCDASKDDWLLTFQIDI
jgi:hypothetical protein